MARETFAEGEEVEFKADTLPDERWRRGRYIRSVAGWHEVRTTTDRFSVPPRRIRKVAAVEITEADLEESASLEVLEDHDDGPFVPDRPPECDWCGGKGCQFCDGTEQREAEAEAARVSIESKARLQIARHTAAEPPQPILDLAIASQHLHTAIGRLTTHQWAEGGVVQDLRRKLEMFAADLMGIVEAEVKRRETA